MQFTTYTYTYTYTILDTKVINHHASTPLEMSFQNKEEKKQYLIPIGSSFKLALQVHSVFQAGDGELQCLDVWQLPILELAGIPVVWLQCAG